MGIPFLKPDPSPVSVCFFRAAVSGFRAYGPDCSVLAMICFHDAQALARAFDSVNAMLVPANVRRPLHHAETIVLNARFRYKRDNVHCLRMLREPPAQKKAQMPKDDPAFGICIVFSSRNSISPCAACMDRGIRPGCPQTGDHRCDPSPWPGQIPAPPYPDSTAWDRQ